MEAEEYEVVGNVHEYILNKINTYYIENGIECKVMEYFSIDAYVKGKDKGKLMINSYLVDNKKDKTYDIFDIKIKKMTLDEIDNSKNLYVNEDISKYDNSMKVNVLDKFNKRISLSYDNLKYVRVEKGVINSNFYFSDDVSILNTKKGKGLVMEGMLLNINYESVRNFTDYLYLKGYEILEVDNKLLKSTKGITERFKGVLR